MHYLNSLESINTSNARIKDFITGKYAHEKLPPTGVFLWVDVRDVALAHVRAIEVAEAGGKRFFVTAGFFTNKKVVDAIRAKYPQLEGKLPSSKDAEDDMPEDIYGFDNKRSVEVLGIKYRSLETTVVDTVESLLAVGA